jgi:hypothetical protein
MLTPFILKKSFQHIQIQEMDEPNNLLEHSPNRNSSNFSVGFRISAFNVVVCLATPNADRGANAVVLAIDAKNRQLTTFILGCFFF